MNHVCVKQAKENPRFDGWQAARVMNNQEQV